mgnify:CR=1 FL=1
MVTCSRMAAITSLASPTVHSVVQINRVPIWTPTAPKARAAASPRPSAIPPAAIPAVIFHRYLSGRVDRIVVRMEEQAMKMVEVMHGQREK